MYMYTLKLIRVCGVKGKAYMYTLLGYVLKGGYGSLLLPYGRGL